MFATHQKTSSGQRTFCPKPIVNYSNVELSVPLAVISPLKTQEKIRFYCFYCNHLSYSKSELNHHMVQKHSRFPFKCQSCDYGSMRREYVVRHMKKMHAPSTDERPLNLTRKFPIRKHPSVPSVSNASPGPTSTSTSSVSPFGQITASCSETIATKINKDGHRGETVGANILSKNQTELLAPLNEQIENNKPLTISLPKEVTIPAGCFVELIEVNTVNGKKELKLRLVSQQPSGSLMKDCRDTTSQKATTVESSSSVSASSTTPTREIPGCKVNRLTLKRKNCNQHFQITKDEPRESNSKASSIQPSEIKEEVVKDEHCVSHPRTQRLTSPPVTGVAVTENIQGTHSSVDFTPETNGESSHPSLADQVSTSKLKVEESSLSDSKTSTWIQTGGWDEKSFEDVTSGPEPLPVISCVFSLSRQWEDIQNCPQPLLMAVRRMVNGDGTPSVKTSLIYEKQMLALATRQEENIKTGNAENKVDSKDLSTIHEQKITPKAGHQEETESTEEDYSTVQTQTLYVEEDRRLTIKNSEGSTQCLSPRVVNCTAPARTKPLSMSVQNEASPSGISHMDPFMAGGMLGSVPQCKTNKQDICPRFSSYLTIPLKRIKLDSENARESPSNEKQHIILNLRRQEKKRRKLEKISRSQRPARSLDSSGNFVGLKADQHVKQPGPNQPVVVLNLAKPHALRRKAEADSITDTVDSEVIPTCHILKMKLNKVMGQKYEVSGCTVRVCL